MIHKTVFIANGAKIIGNVDIGEYSSVWYNAVLRGDMNSIKIGKFTSIQDNCIVHSYYDTKVSIGDHVTVGHGSIIHGAIIKDCVVIGMGSIVMDNAIINDNTIIGAGSVVTQGKEIPKNSLVMGIPGKVVRELNEKDFAYIRKSTEDYVKLAKLHKAGRYKIKK